MNITNNEKESIVTSLILISKKNKITIG